MLHPHTELRCVNASIGHGVFATRPIPRGTITWARCALDQTFEPGQVKRLPEVYRDILETYSFVDGHGLYVLCWDLGRFVNHSCRPTSLSLGFDFEVAIRDIEVGEQLTDDYGTLNLTWDFACLCGEPGCRGTIQPDDVLRFGDAWDAEVADALTLVRNVEQPLWEVLAERDRLDAVLDGKAPVPSCRLNYHWIPKDASRHRFSPRRVGQGQG